jgi:predicted nucleic acid-binding protein
MIDPTPLPAPVSRDPDDDNVLALAVAAQVDCIVSGDDDLFVLGAYEGIPIVTPAQAFATLQS